MTARLTARLAIFAATMVVGSVLLELAFRILDRQPLTRLALIGAQPIRTTGNSASKTPDLKYVDAVVRGPGIERDWYPLEPSPRPRFPLDRQLAARAAKYPADPYTPFFSFNRKYLRSRLCASRQDPPGGLDDFFFFEGEESYPTYRHLPHISPPSWFVTNNFGWRGSDVSVNRPANTVRIAFVGASTTVDSYSVPFSHPELVEHWLNVWAARQWSSIRFEVINAGRTGIDSRSIAAIVRYELAPVDPDLVIFYEGANQFTPGGLMRSPLHHIFPRPTTTFRERTMLERYSALVRRLLAAWDRVRGGFGGEPAKPPIRVAWPQGVDELSPSPHDPKLPMDLPQVVRDLDDIRVRATATGGELMISSFIWLAYSGMKVDPGTHAGIYRYLNDTLWPIPYQHVRRMADFQNRVFMAYARETGALFVDIDREYPRDPDLFDDPIHLNYAGLRLQGWMFLQAIARIANERLTAGRWPRPVASGLIGHPAFEQPARRLVSRTELAAHCS